MQAPPPIPKKQQSDWMSRHWKWVVAGGCLLALIVVTGICALFALGEKVMKSSSVYSGALDRAKSAPAVTDALGTPLKDSVFFTGNISESDSSGVARFLIPLSGPKGSGHLSVYATKAGGDWRFKDLTFFVDKTHERINLLNTNQ